MADWIVVVDDDMSNLKMAGHILSQNNMRVSALKSGKALLDWIKDNSPDLILLDIHMPEMDGFETLKQLRAQQPDSLSEIPVIFLTADEDQESETMGLSLGAMDFIKKPFVPDVLLVRVRHIIELVRLQNNLSMEVEKKTRQNERLSIQIVKTLADTIDAKDAYTNGHSARVADYSRRIAERFGYDERKLSDLYITGLLHDVGKIGIPDVIINKTSKLNDEEYEIIKTHPIKGCRILQNIDEMPLLSIGAHWHHEKFDGSGYPDGLSGYDIPEEARIIAVADAYDAMTSYRSYRDVLPQDVVRTEIEKCKGTQFDPVFADIMVQLIDEDKEYDMREKRKVN